MRLGEMLVVTMIVFQHIPKTGGTSVAKAMQQALGLVALSFAGELSDAVQELDDVLGLVGREVVGDHVNLPCRAADSQRCRRGSQRTPKKYGAPRPCRAPRGSWC
jgi:hypothetical protein